MSNAIQSVTDQLVIIFKAADEVLNSYEGDGNLQLPFLMGMIAVKMNWSEKQTREADPIIRYYVRNNPEWHVTRGAHGGIMRNSNRQKKIGDQATKLALKQQMKAYIETKHTPIDGMPLLTKNMPPIEIRREPVVPSCEIQIENDSDSDSDSDSDL